MTNQISLMLAAALFAAISAPAFAAVAPMTETAPAAPLTAAIAQDLGIPTDNGDETPAPVTLALRAR